MTIPVPPCIAQLGPTGPAIARDNAGHCSEECRAEWAPCSVRDLRPRQHAFFAGDSQAYIYRLESGTLRHYVILPDGRRGVIGFAFPGDLVGLGTSDKHLFNAQALIPTRIRCLPKVALTRSSLEDPQISFKLYEAVTIELSQVQHRALVVGQHDPEKSLAAFILALSRRREQRGEDASTISLCMPRSDIADHLGLTTETVCRTFTKLRRRGLVELKKSRHLRILKMDALYELAGGGSLRRVPGTNARPAIRA